MTPRFKSLVFIVTLVIVLVYVQHEVFFQPSEERHAGTSEAETGKGFRLVKMGEFRRKGIDSGSQSVRKDGSRGTEAKGFNPSESGSRKDSGSGAKATGNPKNEAKGVNHSRKDGVSGIQKKGATPTKGGGSGSSNLRKGAKDVPKGGQGRGGKSGKGGKGGKGAGNCPPATKLQLETGTRIPGREQFAALNINRNQDFSVTAHALRAAVAKDCTDPKCKVVRIPPAQYTATLEQPECLQQAMQGLSDLLTAVLNPGAEEFFRSHQELVRVHALTRILLFAICPWLPSTGRGIRSNESPNRFADLLPQIIRPRPGFGIVTCHGSGAYQQQSISLLTTGRVTGQPKFPLEVFSSKQLSSHQEAKIRSTLTDFSIQFRPLEQIYSADVVASVPCQPLATLASHFQRQLFLDSNFVFSQPPRHVLSRCMAYVDTGAMFFRNVPGTDSEPRLEDKTAPKLQASAMVLDRNRVDLGILGAVSLIRALPKSQRSGSEALEMWWRGFDMMQVPFRFSPFYVGVITPIQQHHVAEHERRSLNGSETVICGKPAYFDDAGEVLFWTKGETFRKCDEVPFQLQGEVKASLGAKMLVLRESVESGPAVGLQRWQSGCDSCMLVRSPWCFVTFRLTHKHRDKPAVAPIQSPRFPFVQQFQGLMARRITSALDNSHVSSFAAMVENDCLVPNCTILKLDSDSFRAPRTAGALARTLKGLGNLMANLFQPGLYDKLAEHRPDLPLQVATLTRKLILATCTWLPEKDAAVSSAWPKRPFDLLPSALQPQQTGPGIVTCAGSGQLRQVITVLRTLREHLKSDIPVEIVYFDDADLLRSDRLHLSARFSHVFFTGLDQIFPELISQHFISGWDCKVFAALATRFAQVALLDADAVVIAPPEQFFRLSGFVEHGAAFFRDRPLPAHNAWTPPWALLDLMDPKPVHKLLHTQPYLDQLNHVQDSSLVVLDRERVMLGLLGTASLLGHDAVRVETQDFVLGDKELFWMGFEIMGVPYRFSKWLAGNLGNVQEATSDTKFPNKLFIPKNCPQIPWKRLPRHCGHMLQFDDAGNLLFANGGLGVCDHREETFTWSELLVPTSFVRVAAASLPDCYGAYYQFLDDCGWCLFLEQAQARKVGGKLVHPLPRAVNQSMQGLLQILITMSHNESDRMPT